MLFGTSQDDSVKVLSPQEFKEQIEKETVQLIDVRTPNEYQSGHIKGAENIDFYSPFFKSEFEKLNTKKPLYIYCRSGMRSRQASKQLIDLGFTEIYDLKGGYSNWK
jgi:rhodanese-related sulfurtransferase